VANDTDDNFLYLNRGGTGKLHFVEEGFARGVARDDGGVPNGSMGLDAADYDGCGRPSLWVTNYENELHGLYRNTTAGERVRFLFATQQAGVASIGRSFVGFGTAFFDFDRDGHEDLVVANGHVIRHATNLRQKPVLLRNRGGGQFDDVTPRGGDYFRAAHLGRGLAAGDLDNDGRIDLVVSHLNHPVAVLRNETPPGHHWLGVELVGRDHRDVVGAKVVLEAGGRKQTMFARGGGSYLSSGDRRLLFGLGAADRVDRLTVVWPSGRTQQREGAQLAADRYHRIVEE
jgi:enediyne biosynthesis protein E4